MGNKFTELMELLTKQRDMLAAEHEKSHGKVRRLLIRLITLNDRSESWKGNAGSAPSR